MKNKNYGIFNYSFIDNFIENKRLEMFNLLNEQIKDSLIESFLDIGTTEENKLRSSNFFVKKFNKIKIIKSITDQDIIKNNFNNILKKSITSDFTLEEIDQYKSDLVISSATIEHVGSNVAQMKMIENICLLTNKYFFITTPNRFFPIDFHTKLPLIHMLPKKIHRKILNMISLKEYALEENLNLLDISEINKMLKNLNEKGFLVSTYGIKLFGLTSNLLILGKKINS
tara:strand:- start:77 stop:760 length:684 start_codon:yes stop_codon:yes gene_type:complete